MRGFSRLFQEAHPGPKTAQRNSKFFCPGSPGILVGPRERRCRGGCTLREAVIATELGISEPETALP